MPYRTRVIDVELGDDASVSLYDRKRRPEPLLTIEIEELNARGMYVDESEMEDDAEDLSTLISARFNKLPEYNHPVDDSKLVQAVKNAVLPGPGEPQSFEVKFNALKVKLDG